MENTKKTLDAVGKKILAICMSISLIFIIIGAVVLGSNGNNPAKLNLYETKMIETTARTEFKCKLKVEESGTYQITLKNASLDEIKSKTGTEISYKIVNSSTSSNIKVYSFNVYYSGDYEITCYAMSDLATVYVTKGTSNY